jgi:hypothetical protein
LRREANREEKMRKRGGRKTKCRKKRRETKLEKRERRKGKRYGEKQRGV